jgi:hypothetical protein
VEELHLGTEKLSVLPMALVILKLLGSIGIFYLFLVIFIGILKQQIWVEHGGIFAVLASPAGTLCTFLAMVTQSLITVCHTTAAMALILIVVFNFFWHKEHIYMCIFFHKYC